MVPKPITIVRKEFIDSLGKLAGESHLPYSMLADIFKDAYLQMEQLELEQYERDRKAYEKEMEKTRKDDVNK